MWRFSLLFEIVCVIMCEKWKGGGVGGPCEGCFSVCVVGWSAVGVSGGCE